MDCDLHSALSSLKVQQREVAVLADDGITDSNSFNVLASSCPKCSFGLSRPWGLAHESQVLSAKLGAAWEAVHQAGCSM